MLILSLETATPVCSLALHQDTKLLAFAQISLAQSHSVVLTNLISNLLAYSQKTLAQIEAVAISAGPGSYTGLRIGTSTAKGLCVALDIPLLAVSTLQAMTWEVAQYQTDTDILYAPMIDARRMEVYMAVFDRDFKEISPVEAVILEENILKTFSEKKLLYFGDGAEKYVPLSKPNELIIRNIHPTARGIGALAQTFGEKVDVAYFEPFYLKEFNQGKKL